jgi:penicillin-binding protein 1A
MSHALMRSINTVAVKLSLKVGREKVLANTKKLGLNVRKSCSMALGDTGITPLQHTAAMAVMAAGGKRTPPYVIEEIRNTDEEVVYLRERDEPPPKQIFERKHVEQLNSMLALVVSSGTGRRAQLGFTTAVGKTGTSSSWRDAWFMGFTGQYVTGVWFGNDNYRPMNRVTGGSLPAMTWKEYMIYAHATPNIPQIPGVPLHPNQVASMQKIAALKRADPTYGTIASSIRRMSPKTRVVLEDMHAAFLDARQAALDTSAPGSSSEPSGAASGEEPSGASGGGRRTDLERRKDRRMAETGE